MAANDLQRGRDAHDRGAWKEADAAFAAADADGPLAPADLELWAAAAYMRGNDEDFRERLARAYELYSGAGEAPAAIRCAFWIAVFLFRSGAHGPAGGWLARAQRLVPEAGDCAEAVYLGIPGMFRLEAMGEYAQAAAAAAAMAADARRLGDDDLFALAVHAHGANLVLEGHVEEGLRLLDEAMLGVVAGRVSPIPTGIVYCGVIMGCETACEVARAQEWTAALTRWCERQPDMLAFTGACLVHRSELLQLRGEWDQALTEAGRAVERCAERDAGSMARAAYRRGEILRLRGDAAGAEAAYREAAAGGREPQPGLALLRLDGGERTTARAMLQRALQEKPEAHERAALLPALLEVAIAGGDLEGAEAACGELGEVATRLGTELVAARAAQARGTVALARAQPGPALADLRRAGALWRALDAPYDTARVRELVGLACRAMGDEETARSELDAAEAVFRELGARADAERVAAALGTRRSAERHGLTARELEVLRLVAGGATNKAIAAELVLSERTVDRHVSNILAKLRVGSRAGATAYAYEHHLL